MLCKKKKRKQKRSMRWTICRKLSYSYNLFILYIIFIIISCSDSDEDDSGTDDEGNQKEKFIPDWARSVNLKAALSRQLGMIPGTIPFDPDTLFSEVTTCSLEEIFGKVEGKFGKYARRTSSAKWEHDELTLVEKRKYRNAMGYSVADANANTGTI